MNTTVPARRACVAVDTIINGLSQSDLVTQCGEETIKYLRAFGADMALDILRTMEGIDDSLILPAERQYIIDHFKERS